MKLGSYIIPDLRLFPKILGDVKILYESYQCSEVENPTAAANLLGHKSANSGSWHSKLADMRLYGLLEPRKIQVTKLAEILTYGTEEEKQDAMIQAIMKVPLWKTLFDDFGENLTNEYFWAQLQKITGVSPLEAQKHADFVRNAYLKDISNIKSELGIRSKDSDI
ncbi:MAG: hypothetical protein KAU62_09930, partial [Candidatus Heimdallarchaeota archaeon]|nr:hypothetical protein [Candidatus Heimdallarchaeota archaeon]MCK4611461.1 hypothetical protein [Candidatus Heimdallarchaeota archaeon]